jgi:imidazole glycerol-phosphate synthase subunit HisH
MAEMRTIGIIDYGMGNLQSVANAVERVGGRPTVITDPEGLSDCDQLILPGVGAFGDGIGNLRSGGWLEELDVVVREQGKPFLGICLGMQLLADVGTEHGEYQGMGWIAGRVVKIDSEATGLRVPHVGWNDVTPVEDDPVYAGVDPTSDFYFVHSYVIRPKDPQVVNGWCDYGGRFAASLRSGNIFATQYHPEKSQRVGLQVLENFIKC